MVTLQINDRHLILDVQGFDRLWALKSKLEIPLAHIRSVRTDPTRTIGWWQGFYVPGTHIPGIIAAGTFYRDGKRIFWDVKQPANTIVIELDDERYDQLIVEVEHPITAVATIQAALDRHNS